jgi:heme A synthase
MWIEPLPLVCRPIVASPTSSLSLLGAILRTRRPEEQRGAKVKQIKRRTIITMGVIAGLGVANLFYCQPLLAQMGTSLGVGDDVLTVVEI